MQIMHNERILLPMGTSDWTVDSLRKGGTMNNERRTCNPVVHKNTESVFSSNLTTNPPGDDDDELLTNVTQLVTRRRT